MTNEQANALNRILWKCSEYRAGCRWCVFCGERVNHRKLFSRPHLGNCPVTIIRHAMLNREHAEKLES